MTFNYPVVTGRKYNRALVREPAARVLPDEAHHDPRYTCVVHGCRSSNPREAGDVEAKRRRTFALLLFVGVDGQECVVFAHSFSFEIELVGVVSARAMRTVLRCRRGMRFGYGWWTHRALLAAWNRCRSCSMGRAGCGPQNTTEDASTMEFSAGATDVLRTRQ